MTPKSPFVVSDSTGIAPRFFVSVSLPGSHQFVLQNRCRSSARLRALVPAVFPSGFSFPFLTSGSLPPSFPTNLPQVCPISGSRPSHIHLRSGILARLRSPRRSGAVVFSPAFPVASLPFLSSSSFHLGPTVSPLPFRQVRSFPFLLSDSGSPSSFRIPVPLPPFGFQFPFLLSDSSSPSSFRIPVLPPQVRGSVLWPAVCAEARPTPLP